MQRSIYLARLIGPVLVAISLGMLLNGPVYRVVIDQGLHSPIMIYFSGVLIMPVGIALVLAHNVWKGDWRLIITILGWLCTFGGAARIIFPQFVMTVGASLFNQPAFLVFAGFTVLVLGAVLSYFGYGDALATPSRRPARKRSRR